MKIDLDPLYRRLRKIFPDWDMDPHMRNIGEMVMGQLRGHSDLDWQNLLQGVNIRYDPKEIKAILLNLHRNGSSHTWGLGPKITRLEDRANNGVAFAWIDDELEPFHLRAGPLHMLFRREDEPVYDFTNLEKNCLLYLGKRSTSNVVITPQNQVLRVAYSINPYNELPVTYHLGYPGFPDERKVKMYYRFDYFDLIFAGRKFETYVANDRVIDVD